MTFFLSHVEMQAKMLPVFFMHVEMHEKNIGQRDVV